MNRVDERQILAKVATGTLSILRVGQVFVNQLRGQFDKAIVKRALTVLSLNEAFKQDDGHVIQIPRLSMPPIGTFKMLRQADHDGRPAFTPL
jgi:hypothetical protein